MAGRKDLGSAHGLRNTGQARDNLKPLQRTGIGICAVLLINRILSYDASNYQHDLQSPHTKPSEARDPPSMPPIQLKQPKAGRGASD
jgi:hypothetical protein